MSRADYYMLFVITSTLILVLFASLAHIQWLIAWGSLIYLFGLLTIPLLITPIAKLVGVQSIWEQMRR